MKKSGPTKPLRAPLFALRGLFSPGAPDGVHPRYLYVVHERQAGRRDGGQGASQRVPGEVQLAVLAFLFAEGLDDVAHARGVSGARVPYCLHPIVEALSTQRVGEIGWGVSAKACLFWAVFVAY